MQNWSPKIRSSIFLKLFLVLVVTGIVIAFAVTATFSFGLHGHFDPHFRMNAERYVRYLVPDLGPAPEFKNGKELAERLGIGLRIEGDGWSWSSSPDVPEIALLPTRKRVSHPLFPFLGRPPKPGPFEIIDYDFPIGKAKVLALAPKRPVLSPNPIPLILLVIGIGWILIASYLALRWILSPIHSLSRAVKEIGEGNLDHRVHSESTDELGKLADGFNEMVTRIKEMIHSHRQLLIDVSHELRSPLTRAKVGLALLDESEPVNKVYGDLNELETMIEGLLESARAESAHGLHLQTADLGAVVRETVAQYSQLGKPLQVSQTVQSAVMQIDVEKIRCVLRNLIENALKYSSPDPVTVSLYFSPTHAHLEVKDSGIGIPASELERVFEPFYRVDKSRTRKTGGFGLGLSLCKKIVVSHGGTISLESQIGVGTTAHVLIPLS